MQVDVYHTHIEVYPYSKNDLPVIEQLYEAEDMYGGGAIYPCGYLIHDSKLYLPRGTSVSQLERLTESKARVIASSDPYERMSRTHYAMVDPRDELQQDSINFLNTKCSQLGLNLATGGGKTYCVGHASTDLNLKTIIITPNDSLKQQWLKMYTTMFDFTSKEIINISSSSVIEGIMNDGIREADVYLVNHQTLHSYMSQHNPYMLHQFFNKIKVGIKVYDEAHLCFANILTVDMFSNTDRTWYLTATFGRSDKGEEKCFRRAFSSVETFGEDESKALRRKHVLYHVVNVNSRVSASQRARLMAHPGFTSVKYGKYAFIEDESDTMYQTILAILNKCNELEGKTMIFTPTIETVDLVCSRLKKDFPEKTVGRFHSKVDREEKEAAEKKDIIVTTIKSMGVGKDLPELRVVICAEAVASKILAEQVVGRLRPYSEDKDTFYFDIVDVSIAPCVWWWKARYKRIQTLVKDTVILNF